MGIQEESDEITEGGMGQGFARQRRQGENTSEQRWVGTRRLAAGSLFTGSNRNAKESKPQRKHI